MDRARSRDEIERELEASRAHLEEFLEVTEVAARGLADGLGLVIRVLVPGQALTLSLVTSRMNIVVSDGVVIDAFAG
jgi:hypothetical protein